VACRSDAELARFPVERVSWLDCQEFLSRLNELEDDKDWLYRLPTEAEWTFACQGGPMLAGFDPENDFYFSQPSKTLSHYHANTRLTRFDRPCRVGVYAPNSLGLFDMHGNVFEWCDDLANIPNKRARWIHGGGWGRRRIKVQSGLCTRTNRTLDVLRFGPTSRPSETIATAWRLFLPGAPQKGSCPPFFVSRTSVRSLVAIG
jgi:formylglycine-generating enzyme required for sulfatase activity